MATNIKELRNDLSAARQESLVFGWAAMALAMGEAEEKSIRLRDRDGNRWRVRLVMFRSPSGNAYSVVFRDLAAGSYQAESTDDLLKSCDIAGRSFGHSYETWIELATEIRTALRDFDAMPVAI